MFDPGGGRPAEANGSFRRPLWGGRGPDREENLSGESIPVIIYIPPCYDPYLQVYPVLFLLHGKPQDEGYWLQLGMDKSVDKGILEGESSPFIIVMPQQPEPLFTQTDGGRGLLEREIMQGLIPFILYRYAITGEGERWAIADISRAGVWGLEIGFQYAEYIQTVAALSPAEIRSDVHARRCHDSSDKDIPGRRGC